MRIGVYVGSFNPVHKGHRIIANYIVDNNLVDILLIIPTGNYWDKTDLIDLKDRAAMLRFYETDRIIVDTEFSNLQYTYQIIDALKEKYKDCSFSLVLGSDNLINFDKWQHYEELLKLGLLIFERKDADTKKYLEKYGKTDNVVIIEEIVGFTVSSTLARENINNVELLHKYLDKEVVDYILENKLYGAN